MPFKAIKKLFKGIGRALFGSKPKVQGFVIPPQQQEALSYLLNLRTDQTPYILSQEALNFYNQIKEDIARLPYKIDELKQAVLPTYNEVVDLIKKNPELVKQAWNDVINQATEITQNQLQKQINKLSILGLANTPMLQRTTMELIKELQLPLMEKQASLYSQALMDVPTGLLRAYSEILKPYDLTKLDTVVKLPALQQDAFSFMTKYRLLPLETQRAIAEAVLGKHFEPIIKEGSPGLIPTLVGGIAQGVGLALPFRFLR